LTAKDENTYIWGPRAAEEDGMEGTDRHYYLSCVRRGFSKPQGKGKKKATNETQGVETLQKFSLGDGVLVAVLGNDVGVGILTRLWDEKISNHNGGDDSFDEEEQSENEEDQRVKLCEVRWFYRKQDLPTTMNTLKVGDVSHCKHLEPYIRLISSNLCL
jgi:hypothetical protein